MCWPESYTNVLPLHSPNDKPVSIDKNINFNFTKDSLNQAMKDERVWLEHVNYNLRTVVSKATNLSWSAFKANSLSTDIPITPAISSLLPLFNEDSKSTAMIRHSMEVIKKATQIVNHQQIPVITFDQPLYAIAKMIQWSWPILYGEDKFVIVLGGLHTEMAILKCPGAGLDGSGYGQSL